MKTDCGGRPAVDAVCDIDGGDSRLLLVSPECGGLVSMVKDEDDVALFCGREDCDTPAA